MIEKEAKKLKIYSGLEVFYNLIFKKKKEKKERIEGRRDWSVFHSDLPKFFHTQMEDKIEREIELEKEKRKKMI